MESALLPIFRALGDARVDYLVVGGVAVVLHGHLRVTGDLDLVVQLTTENARRAMAALSALGYRPRAPVPAESFADEATRERWADEKSMVVFTLWSKDAGGMQIDVFLREPFDYAVAAARSERVTIEDVSIAVASIVDLVAMKRVAGRSKDLDDIVALERIAQMRGADE